MTSSSFRDAIYPQYKATRQAMPEELAAQIDPLLETIPALGWPLVCVDGVEADDVIGTLVREAEKRGIDSVISTGDKDLTQLVNEHVLWVNTMAVPLDGDRLEQLIALMVRGLMFHHWGVILGPNMFLQVLSLTKHGEIFFAGYSKLNAKQRVTNDIGKGALVYEAAQAVDNDAISVWQMSLYGGFTMASGDGNDFMSKFGVFTGPQAIADRADERVASGKFIVRPS